MALAEFSDYPWNSSVFFEGQLVRWDELPRNYLITLFINGLPEFILAGWLLGLVTFAWLCYRKQIVWNLDSLGGGVLFVAGAAPLAAIIAKHAPLYDNFRHVLFTIPPLTILAAAGVWAFLNTFRNKIIRLICIIGFTIAIVSTICDMWALHPYGYTYFNRLVAGGNATGE